MPVLGGAAPIATPAGNPLIGEVPILGMHQENPTAIVKAVLRRGFTPVWLSEVIAAMDGNGDLPAYPVALTLDDGDPAWFTTSHGVFQAYNFKATLCVTSDYLYQKDLVPFSNTGITWDQARTMRDSGLYDWQNHLKTHTPIGNLTVSELQAELTACSTAIVNELGVAWPTCVIYPHGIYDAGTTNVVKGAGYKAGFKFSAADAQFPLLPDASRYTLNRSFDYANLLQWAKHPTIYDYGHDMTGRRNAGNALDFWTMPAEGSHGRSGETLRIDSTSSSAAASIITADYHRVSGPALLSFCRFGTSSHSAGTARLSVHQYDIARTELARLDLVTLSADTAVTTHTQRVALDPACEFVRLEVATDAAFTGVAEAWRWIVREP